ncbi:CTD kinase subunit alpha [Tolypocladium ophioglossoides CBS 100239]|uniref:cyclin-dependent kinase n=1 Tax=Tolypocladium ophioglossoides (strain CBS 100239) TaxID=1163406 RepID=A0A0L0NI31_TOLOC|nr:CTD kinase subunit alpha [Tolypocladium ophioglossoides CBS 100239]
MRHLPKPRRRRRRRHAAMKDVGGSDDHGERARSGRGAKSSDRPGSPPREPRRSPSSRARHRHSRPEPVSHDRHHSRDRSRERPRRRLSESSRRGAEVEDLIPRYRATKARHPEPDDKPSRRSRSRERAAPSSPSSTKRHRGRRHSPDRHHRKRSKKEHSPSRRDRDHSRDPDSRKHRRRSPHDRHDPSHRRHAHSHRSPTQSEDTHSRHRRRSRSRTPLRHDLIPRQALSRESRESRHPKSALPLPPPPPSRSPSPQPGRRHESARRATPPARSNQPGKSSNAATGDRPGADPDHRPSPRHAPPRSPKAHRERRRREESAEPHHSSRSEVDDDMASRSSYRGGHNPMYAHKPYYGNEPRGSDPQGYTQSPQQGGSYHNSPSMSPYGAYRGGWAGQYSPQHQYPPQYHHGRGNYGPPNGPPEHYYSHNPHSPSYSTPSGPTQPYPQGSHRGGYRGGSFRGGTSFPSRGGHRGSSSHYGPGKQGPSPRGPDVPPEDASSRRQSAMGGSNDEKETNTATLDVEKKPAEGPKASAGDAPEAKKSDDEAAAPTSSRPPVPNPAPSQPGTSGKFSFSFKPSSKPTPTAPKPEISQKFNAAPPKKEPEKEPERKDSRDRGPPRGAPTEPASARPRHDLKNAPEGMRIGPRMRKVKKIMKRLKPRPTLPPELAASESVFFRKPGNESVVGSGTYGKVFKARNVYTKGLVALKRIRMEGERDGFPVTAVREIKLLQSLRHTNIVTLQEVMVEKNDCFMVFEYLSHDLTGLLNHPSFKLDPAQRKHLAKQLFEGLDYLHTRGVLHRDIKAANILVGSDGILKLADFGLARFYAKRHQLDYTNRVITIWYRSPELLLGETQYTASVDVWSAACVMVEIFTRHAIFAGDGTELSQLEKIYNILGTPNRQDWPGLVDMAWFELLRPTAKRKSVFAEKYQDEVTPAAYDLLSAMFCYDPAKRPTAAEALQHAYFRIEEPLPRQAVELAEIDGDWHEFESKALRKENERREREARKVAKDASREKDKKRGPDSHGREREAKRVHVDDKAS